MSITEVKAHAQKIHLGNGKVKPGQEFHLNDAATVGDGVWQGDLGIEIVNDNPRGYGAADPFSQLVPGNTVGSRHTIKDLSTVSDFLVPDGWGPRYSGLQGPQFCCEQETTIDHPTHGAVIVAAGHTIRIRYQRDLEKESRRVID